MSLTRPITMTLVPASQNSDSASRSATSATRSARVSMTIMFGVGALRNASNAAAAPPMSSLAWAFSIRRSASAACVTCAISGVSQKTWIEIRGIGAMSSASASVALLISCLPGR